jgi:hypothetical protein
MSELAGDVEGSDGPAPAERIVDALEVAGEVADLHRVLEE